jgi:cell division protein FtsW
MARKLTVDKWLFLAAIGLAFFGLVMVYSASVVKASLEQGDLGGQYRFVAKQAAWLFLGLAAMWFTMRFDYRRLCRREFVYPVLVLAVVGLVAVFAFPPVNGARRWIRAGGLSIQPSEFAKLGLALFLAYYLDKRRDADASFFGTLAPCAAATAVLAGLVALEPDLGTALMLVLMCAVMCFVAGVRVWQMALGLVPAVLGFTYMLLFSPWRLERIRSFLDPWRDPQGSSYHVVQSLLAFGSGGWHGVGFGEGKQKLHYLPYPYADSIFAVVGEELGLIGCVTLIALFAFFLWRGLRAALCAPDSFGLFLGLGLVTSIVAQALFNMSVALSLLPNKGIPLPFISAGGSSLLPTMISVGLLLSISQYAGFPEVRGSGSKGVGEKAKKRRANFKERKGWKQ